MTVVAVLFAGIGSMRGCYYGQLRAVDAVFSEFPEVDKVWLVNNDDVVLEVEVVYFSIVSEPGTIYSTYGIDGVSTSEFRARLKRALEEKQPVQLPSYASASFR